MSFDGELDLSSIFSGFGFRLNPLEDGGVIIPPPPTDDPVIQMGIDRIGVDFRTKGPRYTPTKKPDNTPLPTGVSRLSPTVLTTADAPVAFDGWDLSGYSLYLTRGNVTLRDTLMARGDAGLIDRRGTAILTAEWCDFDGLQQPWTSTMIINNSNTGYMAIRDSKVHDSGVDLLSVTSGFILERCWVYGGGYTSDEFFHFDGMQMRTANGAYSNIIIRDNLLNIVGPRDAASVIRFVTENGATLDDVTIEGNVMLRSLSTEDVPIAIGAKPAGGPVSNVRIRNNWLRYGTPDPIYPYDVPGGTALWQNNRLADSGDLIDAPVGWSF